MMLKAPGSIRIIVKCLAIGAGSGAISGAVFGMICILAIRNSDILALALILACFYGAIVGSLYGLVYGLMNGVAMAFLIKRLVLHPMTGPVVRRNCGLISMAVSVFGPSVLYPHWNGFQPGSAGWIVAYVAGLSGVSWLASGYFYRWYVSNVPVPLGAAPYG